MHERTLRKLLWIATVVVMTSLWGLLPPVYAQEFNIFAGHTNSGSGPWSLRGSSFFGGSFEYPLWYSVGIEQRVGYLTNFPETTADNTQTASLLFDTNLNLNLPYRILGLVPYVTVGVGFMHAVRNDPHHLGTNLDFNYGGGLKYLIPASPFGIRLDMRGHSFRNVLDKSNINTFEYTLGLLYRMRRG